ncbi:hypothetical protein [Streptomyces mirabilis]|uniref:hypothetical protein n=1 Tax=Streptomyces mirabilis TaxID=68239 RepID=UPI00332388CD
MAGYELVRRDATRRKHEVTIETSIDRIAGDLTNGWPPALPNQGKLDLRCTCALLARLVFPRNHANLWRALQVNSGSSHA